jgi:predicted patatin/cPLA2 family phospholipase
VTNAVLELLRDRRQQDSKPGQRTDDARLVLLVEGGSSRGAYSSGMTVAIERLGLLPMFDAVYGSSAGSLNAAWLLCGRADSSKHAWWDPAVMRTTINPLRAFRRQPVVDTQHLIHTIYTQVVPMGFQDVVDNPVEFHPMATDALTGDSADLHGLIHDVPSLQAALRASTAMPFLAGPPVLIDGRPYVDAGLSEMVPVRSALAQKATHLVVLRTVRTDEIPMAPSRSERMVLSRWLARHAPGVVETWLRRREGRIEEEEVLAAHPACLQIRPPLGSLQVGRTERRPDVLRSVVDTGIQVAMNELRSSAGVLP